MATNKKLQMAMLVAVATISFCHDQSAWADSAFAWGYNGYGQLGDGTMVDRYSPLVVTGMSSGATAVAAGTYHSMAIKNGGLYTWGSNQYGELGDGTLISRSTPEAITGLSSSVTAVAAGLIYSLAVQNGGAYAWGSNTMGQLGNGTTSNSSTPVPVTGLSSGVTAVAGGYAHSLAIQNGGVYAWGYNGVGELGNGTTSFESTTPVAVTGLSSGATAIAAGSFSSLAVVNGAVYSWGDNNSGQIGDGTTTNRTAPVLLTALSNGATAVAGGDDFGLAVRNGGVYAWGDNSVGQLGDGTTTNDPTPERIDPTDLTNIVAVAAGNSSSFAISADGSLWVWGNDSDGDLGLNNISTLDFLTPQHLLPPTGYAFRSIDADGEGYDAVATLAAVPVPEPGSFSLLAIGGVGLLRRRRRSI
jgi:alpha-tubulin suppressor-like RCC1 family protein